MAGRPQAAVHGCREPGLPGRRALDAERMSCSCTTSFSRLVRKLSRSRPAQAPGSGARAGPSHQQTPPQRAPTSTRTAVGTALSLQQSRSRSCARTARSGGCTAGPGLLSRQHCAHGWPGRRPGWRRRPRCTPPAPRREPPWPSAAGQQLAGSRVGPCQAALNAVQAPPEPLKTDALRSICSRAHRAGHLASRAIPTSPPCSPRSTPAAWAGACMRPPGVRTAPRRAPPGPPTADLSPVRPTAACRAGRSGPRPRSPLLPGPRAP